MEYFLKKLYLQKTGISKEGFCTNNLHFKNGICKVVFVSSMDVQYLILFIFRPKYVYNFISNLHLFIIPIDFDYIDKSPVSGI